MATNTAAKPATAPTTTSRLGSVKSGVIIGPKRYIIYGAEGTGKTTLAADAPKPIFFDIEGGSAAVDADRYPFHDGDDGHVPRDYDDVLRAVADLQTAEHSYKTLVIDTADRLESLLWAWMIRRDSDPSVYKSDNPLNQIIDYGYGKGFDRAVDVWRDLAVRLDRLRIARKMEIVFLAHMQVKNFKNPAGADYDRWIPAMNEKAGGFLKGWSDVTGMLAHEETTKAVPGDKRRAKGFSTNARVLKLAHSAAFDAKGRGSLPDEIDIPVEHPWAPLAEAIEAGYETDIKKLTAEIGVEVERIGDDVLTAKVNAATKEAVAKKDTQSLKAYLNSLKTRPAKSAETSQ